MRRFFNLYKPDGAAAWGHGERAFDERRTKVARARNNGGAVSAAPGGARTTPGRAVLLGKALILLGRANVLMGRANILLPKSSHHPTNHPACIAAL